jgi:pSer/pThr/pTyr-binding forkhead associated (FHA) protein
VGRIIRYTLAGAIGLLAAWVVMEPTPLMPDVERDLSYPQYFLIGLISGLFIGLMLGVAEALSAASTREAVKSILISGLFGAGGGVLGLTVGSRFYSTMYGFAGSAGVLSFILLLIGRGFGWALIGGLIGMSHGVATSNTKKMINGGIGGFIGGGLGGSVFEILVWMNKGGVSNYAPAMIRFIAFGATGAAIGLFLGFIEEITKQAWLVKLVGRNEGREILLYKPATTLGRDEFADIPVFGDPDVAEKHAVITAEGKRHLIEDAGSYYGTRLNGAKITKRELLTDGDMVEIGKTKFKFRDKATARSGSAQPSSAVHIPTSAHICQFCGAPKDANGNCDCSVGGQTIQQPAQDLGRTVQQQATQRLDGAGLGVDKTTSLPSTLNPQPSTASAKLVGTSGPYANHTFLIDRDMHIGRESTKDIALPLDNAVSRNHARIAIEGDAYVLYDDGSTNGTHVNNAKITRQQLAQGDTVQVGSTKFRFEGS